MTALGADLPIHHAQVLSRVVVRETFEIGPAPVHAARAPRVLITFLDTGEQVVFVSRREAGIHPDVGGGRDPQLPRHQRAGTPGAHDHAFETIAPPPPGPHLVGALPLRLRRQPEPGNRRHLKEGGRQFIAHGHVEHTRGTVRHQDSNVGDGPQREASEVAHHVERRRTRYRSVMRHRDHAQQREVGHPDQPARGKCR